MERKIRTNNHKIVDYDAVLDAKFGKKGTPSRVAAEEKVLDFYRNQVERPTTKLYFKEKKYDSDLLYT